MSRDVAISLEFEHDIDFVDILDRLTRAGWELLREEDVIWYMTDYDWKHMPQGGLARAKRAMRTCYEAGEAVGITARVPDGKTRANVLFHEEKERRSL
ncbi:hypothetical protein [Nonomuraea sp. NPDC052265]|uniref:hypothetical protein n=1 Tax=Nonomuraea sp. NPDC052265 TaxID=3364374 RepID=UPI0037C675EE